jgi:D-sedoheptulose 7-phosphate isomerase
MDEFPFAAAVYIRRRQNGTGKRVALSACIPQGFCLLFAVVQTEGTPMKTEQRVETSLRNSARTIETLVQFVDPIAAIGRELIATLKAGGKILTAGNGGSAAEALHLSEELVGRFKTDRPSLPAVALVADCTALTCIGNDFGFDRIFSRQVEGLGREGDLLVLFSTSGRAMNLSLALEAAHGKGMKTLCLLGQDGGRLAGKGTWEIIVPGAETARIQEAHQVLLHIFLEIIEEAFTG